MKAIVKVLLVVSIFGTGLLSANGIYEKVENMKKGVDGYILGSTLKKEQQNNSIPSDNDKVKKYLVNNDLLIAINVKNNKILAINKRFNAVKQLEIKSMIGSLIHDYDEPTAMAHDKMIYWVYDKNGKKLTEDDLKNWKDSLKVAKTKLPLVEAIKVDTKQVDFDPYISIKMTSDQPMMSKVEDEKLANVYLMVSSEKLIQNTMK
ncbi:MAG: hypothetical protein K8R39_02305 [Arcobacteraceae bacterium]|nr:hypothetical protein [Arcobacteraceae bacterium]